MPARSVTAFHTGIIHAPRLMWIGGQGFFEGLRSGCLFVLCFAIELADGSFVTVDAGFGAPPAGPLARARVAVRDRAMRVRLEPEWRFGARLRALGIGPGTFRAAIVTHLDLDHTGGLRSLPAGPVYMSRAAARFRLSPALLARLSGRVVPEDFAQLPDVREADFTPDPALPDVEGSFEVPETGGALAMVPLPGHAHGHAGVLVRLEGARVLLCGDAAFRAEEVTEGRPLGLFPQLAAVDRAVMHATVERLRAWRRRDPDLLIVPCHDPATGARCLDGPARIAGSAVPAGA